MKKRKAEFMTHPLLQGLVIQLFGQLAQCDFVHLS